MAVLLDAAPHLQELTLLSSALPYDMLPWVGERCHELRTLITTAASFDRTPLTGQMTPRRWDHRARPPADLPLLTSLC